MDTETKIIELERKIEELTSRLDALNSSTTIPYEVGEAFKKRILLKRASITAPTGGLTDDAEARTAINSIITTLEQLELIVPN